MWASIKWLRDVKKDPIAKERLEMQRRQDKLRMAELYLVMDKWDMTTAKDLHLLGVVFEMTALLSDPEDHESRILFSRLAVSAYKLSKCATL